MNRILIAGIATAAVAAATYGGILIERIRVRGEKAAEGTKQLQRVDKINGLLANVGDTADANTARHLMRETVQHIEDYVCHPSPGMFYMMAEENLREAEQLVAQVQAGQQASV